LGAGRARSQLPSSILRRHGDVAASTRGTRSSGGFVALRAMALLSRRPRSRRRSTLRPVREFGSVANAITAAGLDRHL